MEGSNDTPLSQDASIEIPVETESTCAPNPTKEVSSSQKVTKESKGKLREELYSESLQLSKLELCSAHNHQNDTIDFVGDESIWEDTDEELHKVSDLHREWQMRHDQFHTIGYRDGLIAGKEASAQEGFNIGFKESVLSGYNWGLARGVTSAFAFLPDGIKEKLIERQETREEWKKLYDTIHTVTTTDALKLYYDEVLANSELRGSTDDVLQVLGPQKEPDKRCLASYLGELQSLLASSSMDCQFPVKKEDIA